MRPSNGRGKRNHVWFKRHGRAEKVPCFWCGVEITFDESTLEHLLPRTHAEYHNWQFQVISCGPCNWRRGSVYARNLIHRAKMHNRAISVLIRNGGWMLTEEGLYRKVQHGDAKTGGNRASWWQWDPASCPDPAMRRIGLVMDVVRTLPLDDINPLLNQLKDYYDGEIRGQQLERDMAELGPEKFQQLLQAATVADSRQAAALRLLNSMVFKSAEHREEGLRDLGIVMGHASP